MATMTTATPTASRGFFAESWHHLKRNWRGLAAHWALTAWGVGVFCAMLVLVSGAEGITLIPPIIAVTVGGQLIGNVLALLRPRGWVIAILVSLSCWVQIFSAAFAVTTPWTALAWFMAPFCILTGLYALRHRSEIIGAWIPIMWAVCGALIWVQWRGKLGTWLGGSKWALWDVVSIGIMAMMLLLFVVYLVARNSDAMTLWQEGADDPTRWQSKIASSRAAARVSWTTWGCVGGLAILLTVTTALASPYLFRTVESKDGKGNHDGSQNNNTGNQNPDGDNGGNNSDGGNGGKDGGKNGKGSGKDGSGKNGSKKGGKVDRNGKSNKDNKVDKNSKGGDKNGKDSNKDGSDKDNSGKKGSGKDSKGSKGGKDGDSKSGKGNNTGKDDSGKDGSGKDGRDSNNSSGGGGGGGGGNGGGGGGGGGGGSDNSGNDNSGNDNSGNDNSNKPPEADWEQVEEGTREVLDQGVDILSLLLMMLVVLTAIYFVFYRPLIRTFTLRHLEKPAWRVPTTRRIQDLWARALIALNDAGVPVYTHDTPTSTARRAVTQLKSRYGTPPTGIIEAAEIYSRVQYNIGVRPEDEAEMAASVDLVKQYVEERISKWEVVKNLYSGRKEPVDEV